MPDPTICPFCARPDPWKRGMFVDVEGVWWRAWRCAGCDTQWLVDVSDRRPRNGSSLPDNGHTIAPPKSCDSGSTGDQA